MEHTAGAHPWDDAERPGVTAPETGWQNAIDLIRLVQGDYAGAREQLQRVSQTLADREALLDERLRYALLEATGHHTMRLVPYRVGDPVSGLGITTLGFPTRQTVPATRTRLAVRCLGRFELSWNGNTLAKWQSVKARGVLEFLMTKPREPVLKEVLMESLWPECDTQSANNNLKAAIHALRRTLAATLCHHDLVHFVQGSYMLNPDVELWVDVEEFDRRWATGRRLEKEGRTGEAVRQFELARALYRGDYLQDERYEEWTLLRREALKDTYLAILSKLADHALQAGDYESCIVHCQKILSEDACREDAYRWLMRSYSRMGQRNRALRWYEICAKATRAELDTSPDEETQTLFRRLLNNEPV